MGQVPYITTDGIEDRLGWMTMVEALEQGHHKARAQVADQVLQRGEDTLLSRAAWMDGQGVAVKSVMVFPGNPQQNLPSVHGAMLLFSDTTGAVEAVIDSALVTKWKTVADSLLGVRLLARPDARRLLIIGAGAVAAGLAEAYPALYPGMQIEIWNRNPEKAETLAGNKPHMRAVTNLPEAVARADIISTATMSKEPVLRGEWLHKGQHLDLIGAFTKEMREVDDLALQRARIFVDNRETTIEHIGELTIPLASGAIAPADILGDLYDLAQGAAGRVSPDDITLFKNGGGAHLDLMVGRVILQAWREKPA
ncbi:MAG: ornithine cyclodeaminase [Rhodobacteraceae bacterium]|nr:ornithine cyclodeaminase [Paracoccaceae bacterium]